MNDPLAAVAGLPGVADAAASVRELIDALFWDRRLRGRPDLPGMIRREDARSSSALDGAELRLGPKELPDATPMGRVVAAAERVSDEVVATSRLIDTAPLQLLARLAALAGAGFIGDDLLGRPRTSDNADDPLRLGSLPPFAQLKHRLNGLAGLLAAPTDAPGVIVAGVVHAELIALRPFAFGSGLVARAMGVAVLAARAVDPSGLLGPSIGWVKLGRPAYVAGLRGYLSGTPEGVAYWLTGNARALGVAVAHTRELLG